MSSAMFPFTLRPTESPSIVDYEVVSRRDRSETANRGGARVLRRSDFNNLTFIENSVLKERSGYYLHMPPDIILIGNWYRPGATSHDNLETLQNEMVKFLLEVTGAILTRPCEPRGT